MATIRKTFVKTPFGQTHVRYGGSGKPVILLPNTYLGSQAFERSGFLSRMADRYQAFSVDVPTQGLADLPDHQLTVAELTEALAATMDGLGVPVATIVGSHTGASYALEMAASQPERVTSVVFAGLPMWTADDRANLANAGRFKPWAITEDGSYLMDLWKKRLGITHGLDATEMHRQFMQFFIPGPRVHEPLRALFDYEPRERLGLVKCPTYVLANERDQFAQWMDEVTAAIPQAKTGIVPGGTLVHSLDADAFYNMLVDFIG